MRHGFPLSIIYLFIWSRLLTLLSLWRWALGCHSPPHTFTKQPPSMAPRSGFWAELFRKEREGKWKRKRKVLFSQFLLNVCYGQRIMLGAVGIQRKIRRIGAYTLSRSWVRLYCNNKWLPNFRGLRPQRFISHSCFMSSMSLLYVVFIPGPRLKE